MAPSARSEPSRLRYLLRGVFCWLVLAAPLLGCGFPTPTEMPRQRGPLGEGPGHRRQPLALSPEQEWEIGERAYREVMQEYEGRILPADSPEVERVRHVMGKLVKAAEIEPLQREINLHLHGYRFDWQAHVLRSPKVNAFCLPAGRIFVFTGILRVIGNNDNYLATVLAHEMAHALAHHASERVAREHSGGVLGKLSYNRMQESEADHIGVFLMTFAGYDPKYAPEFWKKMRSLQGEEGGEIPEILSDHPSDATRIRQLRAWVPRAEAALQAYKEGWIAPPPRRAAGGP